MDDTNKKLFFAEKAKTGRAKCKKCKENCESGELRIAKLVPNFFSDEGLVKQWYHTNCLFESFKKARATTKKIDCIDDIDGWDELSEEHKDIIIEKINSFSGALPKEKKTDKLKPTTSKAFQTKETSSTSKDKAFKEDSEDNSFQVFQNLCEKIAKESSYNKKSEILQNFLIKGSNNKTFEGDIYLWMKLLLPSAVRRVYNLQSKQLIKLFSKIFRANQKDMLTDLENGDVSETLKKYFELSEKIIPKKSSSLTLQDVDKFLDELSEITKEDDQIELFSIFCRRATINDLKMVIRLIKHDLRINAGPRHILDALHSDAYQTYQLSRDLKTVVDKYAPSISKNKITCKDVQGLSGTAGKSSSGHVTLMSPISPMLAEACKSVERAIEKNPEGMFSEIKYDGERVQIHKSGTEFRFYTRNLKPVLDHKIARCKEYIPKAFPSGNDMILDSEILVVNTKTGELLPFGTLGVHKKEQFANSEVCLFVFDCIYFNGEDLTKRTIKERKKILENNIKPIKNHVQLSEYYIIKNTMELATMTAKVLKAGLEGLVLKNVNSLYQPGKRGWLKIKKDYLFQGQMADSADLVVLGAWFGTGKKGGMLSIFLMGSYDKNTKLWGTVTKVHSGLDDSTMESLQNELNTLLERCNTKSLPKWLNVSKQLIPDFIAKNPFDMPVWEITGAEFTKSEVHTANGISIRFPRITKIRDDKSPKEATNVQELHVLYENSRENINVDMLFKGLKNCSDNDDSSSKIELFIKTKLYDAGKDDSSNDNDSSIDDKKNIKLLDIDSIKKEEKDDNNDMKLLSADKIEKEIKDEKLIKKRKSEVIDETNSPIINKKQKIKTEKTPESKEIKQEKVNKIFNKISIYLKSETENLIKKTEIDLFKKFGGTVLDHSKGAKFILHSNDSIDCKKLIEARKLYNPSSRHLTHKWLEDCIKNERLIEDYKWYAVSL
ncbi:DNA ligase 3 [Condylostylus longicornis]|uniref:DNA ligase 3 n=1 Tax=Condylostylus longicornis TaxID=2530218 RepID=UPI00244DDD92|nr:DNA ligase 3 [Condylostylus longicornis]